MNSSGWTYNYKAKLRYSRINCSSQIYLTQKEGLNRNSQKYHRKGTHLIFQLIKLSDKESTKASLASTNKNASTCNPNAGTNRTNLSSWKLKWTHWNSRSKICNPKLIAWFKTINYSWPKETALPNLVNLQLVSPTT
jgi:hypothetical protein